MPVGGGAVFVKINFLNIAWCVVVFIDKAKSDLVSIAIIQKYVVNL